MTRFVLAALCASAVWGCANGSANSAQPASNDVAIEAVMARTARVPNTIGLVGSLNARDRILISAQVGGTVAEIPVDFGDRVAHGALLLRLDGREVSLQADVARAALAQAAAACEQARAVTPGRDLGEDVVILDGIQAGETVAVSLAISRLIWPIHVKEKTK
jgi:multidrug efflux pump subunit AcrA (membrane-fusion protein)